MAQTKILLSAIIVTVGFLAWVASAFNEGSFRLPKSPLLFAAFLIPIAYLISAFASGPSWSSLIGDGSGQDTVAIFALWYAALFITALVLGAQDVRVVLALRLMAIATAGVLAIQIVHLFSPAFTWGGALPFAASSIVGSWHDLAIYLALTIFLSIVLSGTVAFSGLWRYVSIAIGILSALLLVVINYSDAWVALGILSLLYAYFRFRRPPQDPRFGGYRTALLWLLLAILAFGMYFAGTPLQRALPASLQITQVEVRPSWQGTFAIGKEVFAVPTQIFFGSGPSTFPREWGRHKPLSVNETQFWNTDFYYGVGFIPTSLVTTGVIGLIAWLALCAALLWSLIRLFRENASASMIRAALVFAAVYLTAYHIIYVPGPAISLLTFLLLGALIAEELSSGTLGRFFITTSWEQWRGKIATVVLGVLGLVLLLGGVQTIRALVSDMLVNRAVVQYQRTQNIGSALRSVSIALVVLSGSDKAHRAGVELGLLQLADLAAKSDGSSEAQAELQGTLNATIQNGLAAIQIDNRNYQNWLTLARLYSELAGAGVSGAEESARSAFAEAAAASPTNPLPYLGLAQLDISRGNDAEARKNLEEAIRIKPDLAAVHFLLSQIAARENALGEALKHATAVVEIAPRDPLGWYNRGAVLYASRDYENAARSFEQAVALENNYANALFLLGLSYYRLDREEDALRVLKAVAATNADDAALLETIRKIESGIDPFGPTGR